MTKLKRLMKHGIAILGACSLAVFLGAPELLAQPTLQITSPVNGTVVSPGQTITVTATTSGGVFAVVQIIGEDPIGPTQLLTVPPYQFGITIPTKITPGRYDLSAGGAVQGGEPIFSEAISIDVERPDNPVQLSLDLSHFVSAVGDRDSILVYGIFSDGSKRILSRSTKTIYSSDAPNVATVDSRGMVTAIAPGEAIITVTHGPSASVDLEVTVMPAMSIMPLNKRLYAAQRQQFTASGYAGNVAVNWSTNPAGVGTIDNTGIYTAPSSITSQQTVEIIATNASDNTQRAEAEVTLYPPVTVSIMPQTVALSVSQKQHFTATVANTTSTGVNWSIAPTGAGSIDSTGMYTAPPSIPSTQTVTVTATSRSDTSKSASATVTLNPPPPPVLTALSPSSGVAGQSIPVTFTGSNFTGGASFTANSSDITFTNVTVVSPAQITANLIITAGATPGPVNITVTTNSGSTAPVAFTVLAAAGGPFSIGNYTLVNSQPLTRTVYQYTYRATLTNGGPAITGATATVVSSSPGTVIVSNSLTFAAVAASGQVVSSNTFVFNFDRTYTFDASALHWTVNATLAAQ